MAHWHVDAGSTPCPLALPSLRCPAAGGGQLPAAAEQRQHVRVPPSTELGGSYAPLPDPPGVVRPSTAGCERHPSLPACGCGAEHMATWVSRECHVPGLAGCWHPWAVMCKAMNPLPQFPA